MNKYITGIIVILVAFLLPLASGQSPWEKYVANLETSPAQSAEMVLSPVKIPLSGTDGYENLIAMDMPAFDSSSGSVDAENVYRMEIKGTLGGAPWTVYAYLRSYDAVRPTDVLNVSANTNIQFFESKNLHLVSDIVGQNANCGPYREQEFGWADGSYMTVRTFMLDKKHVAFVASPFDRITTAKMFDSIILGTSNSMYKV